MELDEERLSIFLSSMEPVDQDRFDPCRMENGDKEDAASAVASRKSGLSALEKKAVSLGVPIIRREMQRLLRVLIRMQRPERILEIGTGIGFSALLMAEEDPALTELLTIESYEKRFLKAEESFRRLDPEGRIRLLRGKAEEYLPQMEEGAFPFIFLDGAKGQYPALLPELKRILSPGGVLVTDNVLQEGRILDSRFLSERRDRTIHKRMREYLRALMRDPELTTTVLSVGDGAAISVKHINAAAVQAPARKGGECPELRLNGSKAPVRERSG